MTHTEVNHFSGDHQSEELFRGSRESTAEGLANVHGDLGNSGELFLALLLDLFLTRDRHDVKWIELGEVGR
jgi:hypothetical protein